MENTYIYKQQKKLRCGYTTGTCAAAASMAAAAMLLGEEAVEQVSVETPGGVRFLLSVEEIRRLTRCNNSNFVNAVCYMIYKRIFAEFSGTQKSPAVPRPARASWRIRL